MKEPKRDQLSKKELAARWQITVRSVERITRRFRLQAADFFGRQPAFDLKDVEAMERRRKRERKATLARLSEGLAGGR